MAWQILSETFFSIFMAQWFLSEALFLCEKTKNEQLKNHFKLKVPMSLTSNMPGFGPKHNHIICLFHDVAAWMHVLWLQATNAQLPCTFNVEHLTAQKRSHRKHSRIEKWKNDVKTKKLEAHRLRQAGSRSNWSLSSCQRHSSTPTHATNSNYRTSTIHSNVF